MRTWLGALIFGAVFGAVTFTMLALIVSDTAFDEEACLQEESPESCYAKKELGAWGQYEKSPRAQAAWIAVAGGLLAGAMGSAVWILDDRIGLNKGRRSE